MISNEVRQRALKFTKNFEDASYEKGEAQTFWGQFFEIFGVSPRLYKSFFENHTSAGFIDALWPGVVAVEHKSVGRDLDKAYIQARDYLYSLTPGQHPKAVVVCDFQNFRIYSMEETEGYSEFKLKDLPRKLDQFQFLIGGNVRISAEEDPVNLKAAELMGQLHDHLANRGYVGEQLEVLLVRLMFMFFADDTGIFGENDYLTGYLERNTRDDGTDLGSTLNFLFDLVNTPEESRPADYRSNPEINGFRYINGGLFEDHFRPAPFDSQGRETVLACARFNWFSVSPAIFGSMFQNVMTAETRRNLGAHYTSETNILKVINPLFMDDLRDQFERAYSNRAELRRLLEKIKNIGIFDPACGCGNFLVISYRELRSLEIDIWKRLAELEHWDKAISLIDTAEQFAGINVDSMYGIEIDDFASQIARAALWLQDHIMNMKVSEEFGSYYVRLPLIHSPHILHGNSLETRWDDFAPQGKVQFIASNPPFIGKQFRNDQQRRDMAAVFGATMKNAGILDYVTCWYEKAAEYIRDTDIRVGLVSTNSITQGQQATILWKRLLSEHGISIIFAHRTFRWTSSSKGAAAVFVVIVGFAKTYQGTKVLYEYATPTSTAKQNIVKNINGYLVDAPPVFIEERTSPICPVNPIVFGSMANDGGAFFIDAEQKAVIESSDRIAAKYIRRVYGSREFINGLERYCFWLAEALPSDLRTSPILKDIVARVKAHRLSSSRATTRKLADRPNEFAEIRQPSTQYLMIPSASSENRNFIPIGFQPSEVIATNLCLVVPNASQFDFGVVTSQMHMDWMRQVAGRLKGDYRYSNKLVYNNFPWPENPTDQQKAKVEEAAQKILDVRQVYLDQGQTLADLYDPLSMPADLLQAHRTLDTAVDRCYRKQPFTDERNRLKYLFALYQHYVTGDPLLFDE
jgi:hypothetical protein